MRNILFIIICMLCCVSSPAQTPTSAKMSPYLRSILRGSGATRGSSARTVTAFVKTQSGTPGAITTSGCRVLARMGSVYVAEIPLSSAGTLASSADVLRIEASRPCTVQLDTTSRYTGYGRVHESGGINRAYTGSGVVMGIMDVGFDLTSPNFYTRDMSRYRISRFWDMLAPDRDTAFVVGRDYVGASAVLAQKHSADNLIISHGTHTLGIAAGSGYDTSYEGAAPSSDICLVNNAVVDDSVLIAPDDRDRYTSATDALGFKYIFDYAASEGKPCVISFSEGSRQAFDEDSRLFSEALGSLVGPGRILVASAGNDGAMDYSMTKKASAGRCGSFVYSPYNDALFAVKASGPFEMVIKSYGGSTPVQHVIASHEIGTGSEGRYNKVFQAPGASYTITIESYPSAYDPSDTVYEMLVEGDDLVGARIPVSVEFVGIGTEIQMYAYNCIFTTNSIDPTLADGTSARTILMPASSPAVICVGATSYREGFTNYKGEYKTWNNGSGGVIAPYSSRGPSFDGRIKPDVVAPGTNVISSYSSYYIEAMPEAFDTQSDVSRYEYGGRTYSWNANTGTSMSSPVAGGIIALWLEADPMLSPDDVLRIFDATCTRRDSTLAYPNCTWGYGEIDAYRGLCHILGIDGIEGITSEARDYKAVSAAGGFDIESAMPFAADVRADVFTVSGAHITTVRPVPGTRTCHVPAVPGIYAVRILAPGSRYQSFLVRVG